MKELNEIEQLIIRSLDKSATQQELQQLNSWIDESEDNRKHYFEFKDVWDAVPVVEKVDGAEGEWSKFNKSITRRRPIRRIGIELLKIAAVAILVFVISQLVVLNPPKEDVRNAMVTVPYGSKTSLQLPDGTRVILNAGSEFSYPTNFAKASRNVILNGEAYFEVAHDDTKPFVISVGDLNVTVLGTKFNIMAYPEFNRIETTLVEGKVQLSRKGYVQDEGVVLKPGQKATFSDNKLKLQRANIELATNWIRNEFYFESIPFHELMMRLEKWYDVSIEYNHEEFKDLTYTGKFRNEETVWQALDAIRMTTPVDYTSGHRKVFITLKK